MVMAVSRAADVSPAPDQLAARQALAAEWTALGPETPEAVRAFYEHAEGLAADLDTWHASPARRAWTDMLVYVAKESQAAVVVDIGCGGGHDLVALHEACPDADLWGVELNHRLRRALPAYIHQAEAVDAAPIDTADLLLCIDVLEHVVDPERYLGAIAQRAKLGALLFETVATFDATTPLHLPANAGWHPGHVLELHGWTLIDHSERVRVWRRVAEACTQRASLLLCAYRNVQLDTMQAVIATVNGTGGWRLRVKGGDALIARSRAIVATSWLRETADDVFLMIDDDIVFNASDADRVTELCRNGYDIVCGAYPVRNGAHFACRLKADVTQIAFGPGAPPVEIVMAATGYMAVSRRVLTAMAATLPLCHGNQPWSFYPLFQASIAPNPGCGGYEWLSEDFGFSELARSLGFRIWLDPQTILTHQGNAGISVRNMTAMADALKQV